MVVIMVWSAYYYRNETGFTGDNTVVPFDATYVVVAIGSFIVLKLTTLYFFFCNSESNK